MNDLLPSKHTNPEAQIIDPAEYGISGVLQFGRCRVCSARKSAYGIHEHDCFQVTICTRGTMKFTGEDGAVWPLLPGRMLILAPHTPHKLSSNNTRGNVRYWLFLPKLAARQRLMRGLPTAESDWLSSRIRRFETGIYSLPDRIIRLMEKMFRLLVDGKSRGPEKRLRLRSMMLDLLISISDAEPCVRSDASVMRPIMDMMDKSPELAYPMKMLVARTKLSHPSILKFFRRETGKTPHQYLMECRIRKATALLRRTNGSVTDIAHALGFASSQHFAATFRRETGETPREWRAAHSKVKW